MCVINLLNICNKNRDLIINLLGKHIDIEKFTLKELLNYLKIIIDKFVILPEGGIIKSLNYENYYQIIPLWGKFVFINIGDSWLRGSKLYKVDTELFLTYEGELGLIDAKGDHHYILSNIMHIATDSDKIYIIDRHGYCYDYKSPNNIVKNEEIKHGVQKAGNFYLTMDSKVYYKVMNRKNWIYKNNNYPISINNVKMITDHGFLLTFDGDYQFDINNFNIYRITSDIKKIKYYFNNVFMLNNNKNLIQYDKSNGKLIEYAKYVDDFLLNNKFLYYLQDNQWLPEMY